MKKQLVLILILLTIFISSLGVGYRTLPLAHATYVEGPITRDTIWTLVDSPFILSNDVTVSPTATLTIEPGVEVRFGGEFSIIVNGQIIADGTDDKTILFTTNDPTQHAFWNTITITGSQQSLFSNCIIEFASNGTTLDGGNVNIQKSTFRSNLENGIAFHSGTIAIQDSNFVDNMGNAVAIDGNGQVDIRSNVIQSNKNGLLLTSQASGNIFVFQNNISNNTEAGVAIETNTFANTVITENNVFSNGFGFSIMANASTYLTRNYVANNTVGFYYAGQGNHVVEFNDIFDNVVGMNVESSQGGTQFVNATHNFWGDTSGPEHDSLSPYAKGNSVVGNGTNFDFLPFLTHPFGYSNSAPTAVLWTDKLLVAPYQTVTFVGADSQDDGSIWQYLFDFNDGASSGWTTLSLFNHSYSSPGIYTATLLVQDDAGSSSSLVSTTINVQNLIPLQTTVSLADSTIAFNEKTNVTAFVSTAGIPLANAQVTLLSVKGGTFEPQTGVTDQNGYFTATFTAPNVTQTTDVRIIARASMTGYADGSDYQYIKVLAPLQIQVVPKQTAIWSEGTITMSIRVTSPLGEPVANTSLSLSCTNGSLSVTAANTDSFGTATFNYTAPFTMSQMNVTLTVAATKSEYADTQTEAYLFINPKTMVLEITATPNPVFSDDAATIAVYATFDSAPVSNATITVASDKGGNFSETNLLTDIAGFARFAYTTPLTSTPNGINATITATAAKAGFLDAQNQFILTVKPKQMSLGIFPSSNTTYSGALLNVTVSVTDNMTSVRDANVSIAASKGTFSPTTMITDQNGDATFNFTAPQVDASSNVTFTLTAIKDGYLEATTQFVFTVNPRTFALQLTPAAVSSGQDQTINLHVTCNEDNSFVEAAQVTISYLSIQGVSNMTDINGICTFVINVPQTPENLVNITVTANRSGYQSKQVTMQLNVLPSEGGLPWLTILLLLIPIVIIVIIIVLIKMKVIVVSNKDDETGPE
jgi:hypothetical protein